MTDVIERKMDDGIYRKQDYVFVIDGEEKLVMAIEPEGEGDPVFKSVISVTVNAETDSGIQLPPRQFNRRITIPGTTVQEAYDNFSDAAEKALEQHKNDVQKELGIGGIVSNVSGVDINKLKGK